MKEKLKKINLKLTELSQYLNISRPTLYKFIEYYEEENYSDIREKVLNVLQFIDADIYISKVKVINYILNYEKEKGTKGVVIKEIVTLLNEKNEEELKQILIKMKTEELT